MPLTVSHAPVPNYGDVEQWDYSVTFDKSLFKEGDVLQLDFPKGTRIRNPREFTPPLPATNGNLSSDDAGKPVVAVTLGKADVTAGTVKISFYGNPAGSEKEHSVSIDRVRDGKRANATNSTVDTPHVFAVRRPEPAEPIEYLARYEALKLAALLERVPALRETILPTFTPRSRREPAAAR